MIRPKNEIYDSAKKKKKKKKYATTPFPTLVYSRVYLQGWLMKQARYKRKGTLSSYLWLLEETAGF
jgi:hypothetical protein